MKKLGKFKLDDKVNSHTTHLVALDGRRTANILRGLIRGVWILTFDWILDSMAAKQWVPELDYEMQEFSKAVEVRVFLLFCFSSKLMLSNLSFGR